jgi:DNA-binding CsgD family transcriptional regulator
MSLDRSALGHSTLSSMADQLPLTPRQQEVLNLWLNDVQYRDLAEQLGISDGTVNPHLKAIAKKLGASGISRASLRASLCDAVSY